MKPTLTVLLTALLVAPLVSLHAADSPKQRPNVLFIISDDLKPLLGCYGTTWIQSPNIDRLAAKGTVFAANYCQVAFCAPTRFSRLWIKSAAAGCGDLQPRKTLGVFGSCSSGKRPWMAFSTDS